MAYTATPPRCPRCQTDIYYSPRAGYVAFCRRCLAFLTPQEFTLAALAHLRGEAPAVTTGRS